MPWRKKENCKQIYLPRDEARPGFIQSRCAKHQYYYRSTRGKPGRKHSSYTKNIRGEAITNEVVVKKIAQVKADRASDYGYTKMTYELKTAGYVINKKKVYRLMKENNMLQAKPDKPNRNFVKFRKVLNGAPLEVLEMDIKFVWVEEHQKHAYTLTVIDTFTRSVLYYTVQYSITQRIVKRA